MGDLYPTPTRLALLRQVDDGAITRVTPPGGKPYVQDFDKRRVTARIAELQQAGWVMLHPRGVEHYKGFTFHEYCLTDEGWKVLGDG